jgi:hypothetical protein
MNECGSGFRAFAMLEMLMRAAATAGYSTHAHTADSASNVSQMVDVQSGTSTADAAAILSSNERLPVQTVSSGIREAGEERIRDRLSSVRIPFVANSGQTDSAVAYYAPTFAGTVFVTRDGQIVYSLPGEKASPSRDRQIVDSPPRGRTLASSSRSPRRKNGWSLTETVVGGRARPSGSYKASTEVSYFLGNDPARWRSGLPTFEGISLGEVWPRISLDLKAHGNNVEKIFTVLPGGDPSRIRMRLAGARRLRLDDAGGLVVATGPGEVTFTPPVAFQERDGVRHSVKATYALHRREYGFRLSDYDPTLPVMIDPLLQATYLGGGDTEQGLALAIHPITGRVYVAGQTRSTNFPGTAGGAQIALGGGIDAFVARLNASLTALDQATYLGGSDSDIAFAVAIHPTTGDVYVAGQTMSTNFPATAGGAQATNGVFSLAAFVAHLNSALTTLHQATYFGGGTTSAHALAIHPTTGDVYAGGSTIFSVLPGTAGGAQPASGGGVDGFVARLNSALTTLDQATYLGGGGGEAVEGLAIHPASGDVYVTGQTGSTDFPSTAGGAQPAHGVDFGNSDAFVAHLNSALTAIVQATYLGGNNQEAAQAIAIHPATGDVYVAGWTESSNFPGTAGGAQAGFGGGDNVFVSRLNSALTTLDQSTYLGSNGANHALALAIHPTTDDVYVAGYTTGNFPGTAGGAQAVFGGFQDAFVAHLNAALTTLDQATYLGGDSADFAEGLAIHPTTGDVYVAGYTFSTNFPGTGGGAQPANAGSYDAFVARLTADLAAVAPLPPSIGLAYKPLEPCRIMDTRNATVGSGVQGPIIGGSLKQIPGFVITGGNWTQYGQPGTPSDCGLTNPPGTSITSVAIVITVLNPNFDAFLGVSDIGNLTTTLSTVALNYTHGQGLSTMYLVPQRASNNIYFALPAGLSANIIFDVVGYSVVSDTTALACTTVSSGAVTIGAASTGSAVSPACSAGFTLSSGSCLSDSTSMKLVSDKASGGNTTWTCTANNAGASAHLTATANCCRLQGK